MMSQRYLQCGPSTEHIESFLSRSLSFLCQFFLLLKCTLRTLNDFPKVLIIWTVNDVTTEHIESFLSGSLSFLCQFFLLLKCTLRTVNNVPQVFTMWTVNDDPEKTPWKDP